MFEKKRKINERLDELERRVRQLECPHDKMVFDSGNLIAYCPKCGKILTYYDDWEEFLQAKINYLEENRDHETEKISEETEKTVKELRAQLEKIRNRNSKPIVN